MKLDLLYSEKLNSTYEENKYISRIVESLKSIRYSKF